MTSETDRTTAVSYDLEFRFTPSEPLRHDTVVDVQTRIDEASRLAALHRYHVLDTPDELEFDDLTELAAQVCETPIALVSFVDAKRQWFKSRVGVDVREAPLYTHAIPSTDLLVVPDTHEDERFTKEPLAYGAHQVRFYAAARLTTPDGHDIGMLCVIDHRPRQLAEPQRQALARLGRQVVARLEHRLTIRRLGQQTRFQDLLLECIPAAVIFTNTEGLITKFNRGAEQMLGYSAEDVVGKQTPVLFHDRAEVAARAAAISLELGVEISAGFEVFLADALGDRTDVRNWTWARKDGSRMPVLLAESPLLDEDGEIKGFLRVALDVTERRLTQWERDQFFNISVDLLCILGTDGYLKRVNPAFVQTLGYREDALLCRPLLDFIHPDDAAATAAALGKLGRGESIASLENRYRCQDGSWKWLSWTAKPASKRGLIFSAARDITELKRTTDALLASEEWLSITLQSIGDGVLATDARGCITFLNPIAEQLTGWSQEAAKGRSVEEVVHVRHAQTRLPAVTPVREVLRTGQAYVLASDTTIIAHDGSERQIADGAAPIRDGSGHVHGVVLVFRDVTEEHSAQVALRTATARLQFLLSSTGAVIYSAHADGQRSTYVSPNIVDLLGYTREECLEPGWWNQRLHPDDREGVLAGRAKLGATGSCSDQYRFRRRDGMWRWILDDIRVVRDKHGNVAEIVGAWSDVTAQHLGREAAEAHLKEVNESLEGLVTERTAQLVLSLQEKETLLKEVHHRVKNNLQIISSLLAMQSDNAPDPTTRDLMKESIHRVRSMALIHERLYQSDTLARIDFADYARSLAGFLVRSYSVGGSIRLVMEVEPSELNIETAVPCGLILNELVSNALKHAFRDGRTGEVRVIVGTGPTGQFNLQVRDTGVGLPADFDVEQAASLGLRLVTSLTKQIKGKLEIRNDGGAHFCVTFKELTYEAR